MRGYKYVYLYIYIFFNDHYCFSASSAIYNNNNTHTRPAINKSLGCLNINSWEYWSLVSRVILLLLYCFNYVPRAFAATATAAAATVDDDAAVPATRVVVESGPYEIIIVLCGHIVHTDADCSQHSYDINHRRKRRN